MSPRVDLSGRRYRTESRAESDKRKSSRKGLLVIYVRNAELLYITHPFSQPLDVDRSVDLG